MRGREVRVEEGRILRGAHRKLLALSPWSHLLDDAVLAVGERVVFAKQS